MRTRELGDDPNCPCCREYREMDKLENLIFDSSTIEIDGKVRHPFSQVEFIASLFFDQANDSPEMERMFINSQIKLLDDCFSQYYKENKELSNTVDSISPGSYLAEILLRLYEYAKHQKIKEKKKPKGFAKMKIYQNRDGWLK